VTETDDEVRVETDALSAAVRKKGYVTGVAEHSLLDKKTGARDVGFGLRDLLGGVARAEGRVAEDWEVAAASGGVRWLQ